MMHAKPDLRVFLEWMIACSGSVITDVITLNMIKKTFSIRYLLFFTLVAAGVLTIYSSARRDAIRQHNELRQYLQPIISSVDAFIEDNGRCPTYPEYEAIADSFELVYNPTFNAGTEYVKRLGGTGKTDYVLADWDGDQNHCYCSWNGRMYWDSSQRVYDYANKNAITVSY